MVRNHDSLSTRASVTEKIKKVTKNQNENQVCGSRYSGAIEAILTESIISKNRSLATFLKTLGEQLKTIGFV